MSERNDFGKWVPGFDFLQTLAKNAGSALPGIGQWVAPTLDPAELDKRIGELRTVQFWLEQNSRLLATTIQALEVQRMTLSTLKSMKVPFADLRESMLIQPPATGPAAGPIQAAAKGRAKPAGGAVDPMQWWSALTDQFTQLATSAMKDGAASMATAGAGKAVEVAVAATQAVADKARGRARPTRRRGASPAK